MILSHPKADIYTPDSCPPDEALARVTHLCVAAHQDGADADLAALATLDVAPGSDVRVIAHGSII